jgi:hypothetical protein
LKEAALAYNVAEAVEVAETAILGADGLSERGRGPQHGADRGGYLHDRMAGANAVADQQCYSMQKALIHNGRTSLSSNYSY